MERLFGTDGVRALANVVLTPELMLSLGRALGTDLAEGGARRRPAVVVGRDPRPSSGLLEAAFVAGLCSAGVDALTVGVLPTAAIAFLTPCLRADAGAVITASHNPLEDNGLKLFDREGYKYSDASEMRLEALCGNASGTGARIPVRGLEVGRIRDRSDAAREAYAEHLVADLPDLAGLSITVDCANGAAAAIAPEVYRRAGASVVEIASDRSGDKINVGVGATTPEYLQRSLTSGITDIGLAHDGDADRLIAVDERGRIADGADLLAVFAVDAHAHGRLPGAGVVTTPMTNSGLGRSLKEHGICVIESAIGDRAVLRAMLEGGYRIGGEQSGHVILLDRATTGDGILSGLRLLELMRRTGKRLHELTEVWQRCPQAVANVPVRDRRILERSPELLRLAEDERRRLAEIGGQLILRLSTIENVVRVVCEAPEQEQADSVVERLVTSLESSIADDVIADDLRADDLAAEGERRG
jgi:phosphoglucosamine mutase